MPTFMCPLHCPLFRPLDLKTRHFISSQHDFFNYYQSFSLDFHHLQPHQVRALQTAFRSNTIPPEILQTLLNLAEFMEHDVEALPISLSILAELAQKGGQWGVVVCCVVLCVVCCLLCIVSSFTSSSKEYCLVRVARHVMFPISFLLFIFPIYSHLFSSIFILSLFSLQVMPMRRHFITEN
jgi:hypothetical protein